ncbi:MAG: hypothetical protein M3R15_10785 [Acidobacteriota bacterium]|nr:hypothetical protein [Acidobacteriota bacterium]
MRLAAGKIGTAPEWFYKGCGSALRVHNDPLLLVPSYAEESGEEPEIAGVYQIAADGRPYRIDPTIGNEFSDHKFERFNYLNLAGSKLRTCAIGPELVIDYEFKSVPGTVTIERGGRVLWSKQIRSGEAEMCLLCATSSITISNSRPIIDREICTIISSAVTPSASWPEFNLLMAI